MSAMFLITVIKSNFNAETFERTLESSGNWLRISSGIYVLHSNLLNSTSVYNAIVSAITDNDNIMIVRIDPNDKEGWMPQWVWDWFNSRPSHQPAVYSVPSTNSLAQT